jgi:hypothetical protein
VAGAGDGGVRGRPGDAEVGHLHGAVGSDQQVGRLDVAVHDPGGVRGGQPGGDLTQQVQRPLRRQPALARQHRRQRLAVHQLHDQVDQPVAAGGDGLSLAVVVQDGDVRVGQPGRQAGLGAEPGQEDRVAGELALEHLDRDLAAEHPVLPAPDLAHAAGRDQ